MYKFPQAYKTSLKCIKINRNCINHPQVYNNWPHLYKQGTNQCINEIDRNWLKLSAFCDKVSAHFVTIFCTYIACIIFTPGAPEGYWLTPFLQYSQAKNSHWVPLDIDSFELVNSLIYTYCCALSWLNSTSNFLIWRWPITTKSIYSLLAPFCLYICF